MIRTIEEIDYVPLVLLYKKFFTPHNRFDGSADDIIPYLKSQAANHVTLVCEENKKVHGAITLVELGGNADRSHKIWKYRNFAFESDATFTALLAQAEAHIREQSKTAKVEVTVAATEKSKDLYLAHGYGQEAALTNHYRWGEVCFIVGKSFS